MSSIDQKTIIKTVSAINGVDITADGTTVGNSVDTKGFESLTFDFAYSSTTGGTFTPVVEDSTDNVTFVAVVDEFLIGTEAQAVPTVANVHTTIGYIGTKQYARASIVASDVVGGAGGAVCIASTAILGSPRRAAIVNNA